MPKHFSHFATFEEEDRSTGQLQNCPGWNFPLRETLPAGFNIHSTRATQEPKAFVTPLELGQLVSAIILMREQISQLRDDLENRIPKKPAKSTRTARSRENQGTGDQGKLPLVPSELAIISDAIEASRVIYHAQQSSDDEPGLICSERTWRRAAKTLMDHALAIWEKARLVVKVPMISAGPDNSVDIYWTSAPYGLLLNVPSDEKKPTTYFGDDSTNSNSNQTSGQLVPAKRLDMGILMWLAHTAA